ncbi:MAG: hypothetical protein WBP03_05405 [Candidatus Saccharimonadales bacterium]
MSPTLAAGVSIGTTDTITLEDCLPAGQQFQVGSASVVPNIVQTGAPGAATLSCGASDTYMRWVFPTSL